MSSYHTPVLLAEAIDLLNVRSGATILDCTMGGGGHSFAMAKVAGKTGLVIGIDRDQDAINEVTAKLSTVEGRMIVEKTPFSEFGVALKKNDIKSVDGILMDIGVSSHQFDEGERGFSYRYDAELDMRMDRSTGRSVADIINFASEDELVDILRNYGEVRNPKRMVEHLCVSRQKSPITRTVQLVDVLNEEYGKLKKSVLSKVFQGFRIAANGELVELEKALEESVKWLAIGGRVGVMSYHSLEDRMVKNFFRDQSVDCICPPEVPICQCDHRATLKVITRKPVIATNEEIERNVRARSARFRVAERVSTEGRLRR
jgi:16S rRNA (cytosine1402-N4)-methyltransferase